MRVAITSCENLPQQHYRDLQVHGHENNHMRTRKITEAFETLSQLLKCNVQKL